MHNAHQELNIGTHHHQSQDSLILIHHQKRADFSIAKDDQVVNDGGKEPPLKIPYQKHLVLAFVQCRQGLNGHVDRYLIIF